MGTSVTIYLAGKQGNRFCVVSHGGPHLIVQDSDQRCGQWQTVIRNKWSVSHDAMVGTEASSLDPTRSGVGTDYLCCRYSGPSHLLNAAATCRYLLGCARCYRNIRVTPCCFANSKDACAEPAKRRMDRSPFAVHL